MKKIKTTLSLTALAIAVATPVFLSLSEKENSSQPPLAEKEMSQTNKKRDFSIPQANTVELSINKTQPTGSGETGAIASIDYHSAPVPSVISHLEQLASNPSEKDHFREALIQTFLKQTPGPRLENIYQNAIRSSNEQLRGVARTLQFNNQVAQNGLSETLATVEEDLFSDIQDEDLLDFIADEIAPRDRPTTLDWLEDQGPDLWEDALPLVLGDWAVEEPQAVGTWINGLDAGAFRDRAIAEYAPALTNAGQPFPAELVNQIQNPDIQQEAKIRTGELSFSVLSQ